MSSTESRYPSGSRVTVIIEYFDESTQEEVKQTTVIPNIQPTIELEYPYMSSAWWDSSRPIPAPDSVEFSISGTAYVGKRGHYMESVVERVAREAVGQ